MPATNPVPANYYNLRPGDEYIVMDGRAIPIRGLSGQRQGGSFYPNLGARGYHVKTREATHAEAARERQRRTAAEAPRRMTTANPFSDWK